MNRRKIFYFAAGPLVSACLSIVSIPLITWFFSLEDVGRLSMLQVTISFSILFFSFGLDQAYIREFHDINSKPTLFKTAILPGAIALVAVILSLLIFNQSLSWLVLGYENTGLSTLIILSILFSYFARFVSLILRMNERAISYSMSQILPKLLLLLLILIYITINADNSLFNLLWAFTLANLLVLVTLLWSVRHQCKELIFAKFNTSMFKSLINYGFPLIWGNIAFWGLTAVDKIFLRALSDFDDLGLYSVSISFASSAVILQSIFSTIWAPQVFKWISEDKGIEKINFVIRYLLAIVSLFFAGAGLLSWLVVYILPPQYESVSWIMIACFGYPLLYTLSEGTVVGIAITRRSVFSMLSTLIAFIINLVGNWYLIPIYGASGAAVSTCFAFFIFFVLRTEFSIYLWKKIPRFQLYFLSVLCVIGASFQTLVGNKISMVFTLGYWVLFLFLWYLVFKSDLVGLKSFVCKKSIESKSFVK